MAGGGDRERFAALLRDALAQARLTPNALALGAGLDKSVISRWVNGHTLPSYENLCQVLGVFASGEVGLGHLVPAIAAAAGCDALAAITEVRPAVVTGNWDHPDPQVRAVVRELWGMRLVAPDLRVKWVTEAVENAAAAGGRRAGLAGLLPVSH